MTGEPTGPPARWALTDEDRFNALAATTLAGTSDTPVYRLAASPGVVAPYTPGETLFAPALTPPAQTAPYAARRPHHYPVAQRRDPSRHRPVVPHQPPKAP